MNTTEMKYKLNQLGELMKLKQERQTEFDLKNQDLDENINGLKAELKTFFLERKESEKTDLLEVSYRKGAVRWDSKGLKEYSKVHPEIKAYQVVGEPTIAFTLVKPEAA